MRKPHGTKRRRRIGHPGNAARASIAPVLAALTVIVPPVVSVTPASASSVVHPFISAFGPDGTAGTHFFENEAVAVDQGSHDIYVQERRNSEPTKGRVYRFNSAGEPDEFTEGPGAGSNRLTGFTFETGGSGVGQIPSLAVAPPGAPGGTAGDLYVASPFREGLGGDPDLPGRLDVYSPGGAHLGTLDAGANPHGGSTEVCAVTVSATGDVYVAYQDHIDKYVPSADPVTSADFDSQIAGESLGCVNLSGFAAGAAYLYVERQASGGATLATKYPLSLFPGGGGSTDVEGHGTALPTSGQAFAVDSATEDLFIGNYKKLTESEANDTYRRVVEFDEEGNRVSTINDGESTIYGVAVDSTLGNVYASNSHTGVQDLRNQVRIYGPGVTVDPPSVAIDPPSSVTFRSAHLTGRVNSGGTGEYQQTLYRFSCTPECPGLEGPREVPADNEDHEVSDDAEELEAETEYEVTLRAENTASHEVAEVSTSFETPARPPAEPPAVTIDLVTEYTTTTAHLTGTVDPMGTGELQQTTYRFEYSSDGLQWEALEDHGPIVGEGFQPVSDDLAHLEPGKTYSVRLRAENLGGEAVSGALYPSFTTPIPPPDVEAMPATGVLESSAQINGLVNPRNSSTTYHFEWGEGDCAAGGCRPIPVSEAAKAGSGGTYRYVHAELEGLSPGRTYYFRLVAQNGTGKAVSGVLDFTTETVGAGCRNEALRNGYSATLPDCRAFELVSPLDKNGGHISADPGRARSASDGNAVSFLSPASFAGSAGLNDKGAEYVSRRGSDGWITHPITPQHETLPMPTIFDRSAYVGRFSSDLSKGVFIGLSPLPGVTAENVEGVSNLFLGRSLGSGAPSMRLLSDAVAPLLPDRTEGVDTGYKAHIRLAAASADLGHLLFESTDNLTGDASGTGPKLYEWSNGSLRLAGILPDDACGSPPCPAGESVAGAGAGTFGTVGTYTQLAGAMSADGSRVFFTAGALKPVSSARATGVEGKLYMREDGTRTVQIDASERSKPGGWVGGSTFEWAAPDGRHVFFISTKMLTDDDNDGGGADLYRYDMDAPAGEHLKLLTPDWVTPDALDITHVIGVSTDGKIVYFLGAQEAPESSGDQALYVLRGDTVRYVAYKNYLLDWGESGFKGLAALAGSVARMTPDGRHLLFTSWNGQGLGYDSQHAPNAQCALDKIELNIGQQERCAELFLYSLDSGELVCVSCDPAGTAPVGNGSITARLFSGESLDQYLSQPLSSDGRRVFFDSGDALVPRDTNGKIDVYEYDTESGKLSLLSSGQCNCDSYFDAASPSGNDVFIVTRQQLVRIDTDNLYDLYDVRVDGGIAAQIQPPPGECEGDACQPTPLAPQLATPASSAFHGAGNLAFRRSCSPLARRLRSMAHRNRALRHRAHRLTGRARRLAHREPRRARALRRVADRLATAARHRGKLAKRLARRSKSCRSSNRRAGR